MKTYTYTDADNCGIKVEDTETGEVLHVPADPANKDYREILGGIDAGEITIAPWTSPPVTEAQVRAEGARRLGLIASPYAPEERETWHEQVREAEAVTADPAASTPLLSARAAARGVTAADLAATVLSKRDAYRAAAGAVLGAQDAILALDPIPADFADDSRWPA